MPEAKITKHRRELKPSKATKPENTEIMKYRISKMMMQKTI
jgi:hypothetical protein